MNTKEKRELYHFPSALDASVNGKFPKAQCSSSLDIFSLQMVTRWNEKLPKSEKQRIKDFVEGFMAGNSELADRLGRKSK